MFNLIVSSGPESSLQGSITAGRVFEYTDDLFIDKFKPGGNLDIPSILSFPTLFMQEGTGNEVARIVTLNRLERRGAEYRFRYSVDPEIPAITNAEIVDMATELGIADFEFHRNHWALKDSDLFQVMFRNRMKNLSRPSVFQLSQNPINLNLVSLMMPFSGSFTSVYEAIRGEVESYGFECSRADDFWQHTHIIQDVIELICTSRVVICDLSGKNPNVFYEVGIAHTLGKDVILITQSMDDVPFDLRALRCITYLNNNEGRQQLAAGVAARLRTITGG